ncbi:MAG: thiamine pyrophosphate-dependent enzyme [Balneolaceae bacterium]
MAKTEAVKSKSRFSKKESKKILEDYKLVRLSREMSKIGRKEVLTGKAKFGIFGDGKELPQIAMANSFQNGDFRSGYYRDQTFMMAIGQLTVEKFFTQLYGHPDTQAEPSSGGRQMNAHFATRLLDEEGKWKPQTEMKNSAADLSPTASHIPRLLGLAQASKVYRENEALSGRTEFSNRGREVAFGTIGDASTTEGIFWETVNAAGVLQLPLVISVWDDGYGISVSKKYQTTKESISKALEGFQRNEEEPGIEIFNVKAWDYEGLQETYRQAAALAREEHVPALIHVEDVTQPQGHSTSGSHERYKSDERLEWEEEYCCCKLFREWIIEEGIAKAETLDKLEEEARKEAKEAKDRAWDAFQTPIKKQRDELVSLLDPLIEAHPSNGQIRELHQQLQRKPAPIRKDLMSAARKILRHTRGESSEARDALAEWLDDYREENRRNYNSHLVSESDSSPMRIDEQKPEYPEDPEWVDGRVVLRDNFDKLFERYPELLVFGEDVGRLGDVNLGLEGLQNKYGELRVADTGIREATILGQGTGLALRGLRPIAEIQYLDYLLYCLQGLSDDVASLRYRTAGGQKVPLIVRTRGHRLEGIWHSGSPLGMVINGIRGVHVCVPRNLTGAAGFYNTLLQGDDPALVIEPLNGYRLKEKLPSNLGDFTLPLGVPEIVREGSDITVASYGATFNIIESILPQFEKFDISVELIDVRTLLPFDIHQVILGSLKKTNRILFVDEDVPGGATGFMMQQVIDHHGGYYHLDSEAKCLSAEPHRTPFTSDGDYFSKPNDDDIFEAVYAMMSEANPRKYPAFM